MGRVYEVSGPFERVEHWIVSEERVFMKRKVALSAAVASFLFILNFWGCTEVCPPKDVSFQKCVRPTLEANCGGGGCHGGDKPAAGLILEGDFYEKIVKKPAKGNPSLTQIEPKKPLESYLYLKLLSPEKLKELGKTVAGEQMPLNRPKLWPEQIEMLKAWIKEGAKNN